MQHRFILFTFLSLLTFSLYGQTPQNISLQAGGIDGNFRTTLACGDQFAGTITFQNFIGASNDTTRDTLYLCFGDEIEIRHRGDANLTGDPNPGTTPGITYGFFKCKPTISGPNKATILTETCILKNPPPANGIWVTSGGNANGNLTLINDGSIQSFYSNGNPLMVWYAPLTVDNFALKQYENDPITSENGPCVNLNVTEAFAVVYLNEIQEKNKVVNAGQSGCLGTFELTGGLSQFDSSFYNISIVNLADSSIKGQLVGGPFRHGEKVSFNVPVPAFYRITISDGKSCPHSFNMDMSTCVSLSQSIQNGTVTPNDTICLKVTNEGGFNNIVSMQYALNWNDKVLQFIGVKNLTKLLPSLEISSFNSKSIDTLIFSWFNVSGLGVNFPTNTVLYEMCFKAVGNSGDCSDVKFTDIPKTLPIEVVTGGGNQIGFNGVNGQVCVSASALLVTLGQDSVKCSGASDGRISVKVSGGKAPYKITWRNIAGGPVGGPASLPIAGGTFVVPNLPAGTYSVTVSDDQIPALTSTKEVKVLSPKILNILLTENAPQCSGQLGSINSKLVLDTVVVSNPQSTYRFLWSTGDTILNLLNIPAGGYSLTVTDRGSGCTTTNNTVLPQPSALVVTVGLDTASCSGKNDGNINILITGGSPDSSGNYSINWPTVGPAPGILVPSDRFSLNGRPSAIYPLRITDSNGCINQQNIFLPARRVLRINAVIDNVNCVNDCSGSIFASGNTTGGPASLPYKFNWFGVPPPPPPTASTSNSITLSGLCPGIYQLVMQDTLGCQIDTTFNIVSPPELVAIATSIVNESCKPGKDGSLAVRASGGTQPYQYKWSNGVTDSTLSGLSSGTYSVIVSDLLSCADTLTFNITAPSPPVIQQFNDHTVPCSDSKNGVLQVIAVAGSAPLTAYSWSNGSNGTLQSGLGVGLYSVTVNDSNGCSVSDTAEVISAPPMIVNSINKVSPTCPGQGGGSLSLSPGGGKSPYFFQWSTGVSGVGFNVLGNIKAGNYTVTITDDNGCKFIPDTIQLDDPARIQVAFNGIDSVSCYSGQFCDGKATANANYSNGNSGVFNFTWQSGETGTNAINNPATQLCRGSQWVVVSDGICFDTFRVNIPSPPAILPGASINNVSCNGVNDGSVTLKPAGGNGPYTISWASGQLGPTISGLGAGNYTALISDSKNCIFTHTVSVIQPDPLDVFVDPTGTMDVSCPGEKNGSIAILAQGGNISLGGIQYLWKNGIAAATATSVKNLAPGVYSVTAVDQKGCTDSLNWSINEPPPIRFSLGKLTPIQCFGGNTFISVDSVWGGRPSVYQYSIDGGINRQIKSPSSVFAGQHLLTVIDVVNLCSKDSTIVIKEPLELSIQLPKVVEIQLGDTLTRLIPNIISSVPIDSFAWSPASQLSCSNCKNPTVSAIKSQQYKLTIKDANGCVASAEVYVDVDKKRNVFVPNAFSPNDDGINDKFQLFTGLGVTQINFFRIYDRWGEMMFEVLNQAPSPDGSLGWDGRFNGQKMKPGVFLYLIEVEYLDGRKLLYRGDVTLLR